VSVIIDQQHYNSVLDISRGVMSCSVHMSRLETNTGVFLDSRLARGVGSVGVSGLVKLLFPKIEIPRTPRCSEMSVRGNKEKSTST